MFPLSHTYVATQATNQLSPNLILGSILPDIGTNAQNVRYRDLIHNNPDAFYRFVEEKYPQLLDLAVGVQLHSQINKGADFYSDDTETGYAKIKGRILENDVVRLLGEDTPRNRILAHNFIEIALDLLLLEEMPNLLPIYRDGWLNADYGTIAEIVSEYTGEPSDIVQHDVEYFRQIMHPDHLVSPEAVANGLGVPLIAAAYHKNVSSKDIIEIILKAQDLVEEDGMTFLRRGVTQIRQDFPQLCVK